MTMTQLKTDHRFTGIRLGFDAARPGAFSPGCLAIRAWRPDVIVGFGGFTTAGIIVMAALFRRPVALHEANRVPGRAIRLLGGLARRLYLPAWGRKGVDSLSPSMPKAVSASDHQPRLAWS